MNIGNEVKEADKLAKDVTEDGKIDLNELSLMYRLIKTKKGIASIVFAVALAVIIGVSLLSPGNPGNTEPVATPTTVVD